MGLFEEDLSSEVFCCVSTLCGHLAGLMKIQEYSTIEVEKKNSRSTQIRFWIQGWTWEQIWVGDHQP